jgi:plastocyanin
VPARRLAVLALAGLAGAAIPALSSAAPAATVHARPSNTFAPQTVTVQAGDTVSFTNDGGTHNVQWDDGGAPTQPAAPSATWTTAPSRTFGAQGSFAYRCQAHGSIGMRGTVVVVARPAGGGGGTTTTDPGVQPVTTATPVAAAPRPLILRPRWLTGHGLGAVLRFALTSHGPVAGVVLRRAANGRYAFYGRLGFSAHGGLNSRRINFLHGHRPLAPGSYSLHLRVRAADRTYSAQRVALLRVLAP